MWRGDCFCGGWNFSKTVSVDSTFIREMRVHISNIPRAGKFRHYPTSVLRRRVEELRGRTAPFCSPEWMDEFNRVRSAMH